MLRNIVCGVALCLCWMLLITRAGSLHAVAAPARQLGSEFAMATDPAAVADAFDAAANAGDVDAWLALFTDDAVVTNPPAPPYVGKAQIRIWLQRENVDKHVHAELVGARYVVGNKVSWVAKLYADDFKALGLNPLTVTAEMVVDGGKVKSFFTDLTAESAAKLQAASGAQPGMPATGQGDGETNTWLLLAAGILLCAGMCLRKTHSRNV